MDDTPEIIRQQMEETKSQLSDKMESLEHQVSETVHSTGTAVNATVASVQETVETVTGAVHDAVQSVSNAFDLRRQISKHPWLVLGGAFALGYLAVDFLKSSGKKPEQPPETGSVPSPSTDGNGHANGPPAIEPGASSAAIAAIHESGSKSSSWHQLSKVVAGALVGAVGEVAARAVPHFVDYITGNRVDGHTVRPEEAGESRSSPMRREPVESADSAQRLRIAPSESVRSINSP